MELFDDEDVKKAVGECNGSNVTFNKTRHVLIDKTKQKYVSKYIVNSRLPCVLVWNEQLDFSRWHSIHQDLPL